jgi:hypothetical protein
MVVEQYILNQELLANIENIGEKKITITNN